MKKFRFGVPLMLVLLLAGSVYELVDSRSAIIGEYHAKLRQAREDVQDGVLTDGLALYKEVLKMHPSVDIYTEAGNVYLDTEDLQGAHYWYEREFAAAYPDAPQAYEYGIRVSLAAQDYREAFEIYDVCKKREAVSDTVEKLMQPIWYSYEILFGHYDEVGEFSSQNGFAAVRTKERWGYVNQDGVSEIPAVYDSADVFADYAAVVDTDGNACYIDASGDIRMTASQFLDEQGNPAGITWFRPDAGGLALAYDGRTWSYYDLETNRKQFGGYVDATVIANGIGAVTKDGSGWALIDAAGKELTGYDYKQVVTNGRGILCCTDSLFVKQDGKYWLVDRTGKKVSQNAYDAADGFYEDSLAAVQKNGTWVFVNASGEEKDLGSFEEAKSFSNGLAAVKKDDMWGYIDQDGNQVVACTFYDAGAFNSTGAAFVKPSEKEWSVLSLYRYHFE